MGRDGTLDGAVAALAVAPRRVLLLDYDGTLIPIASRPEEARPDAALLDLLARRAAVAGPDAWVVSGRPQASLDELLGALPIGLVAEHGLFSRPAGGAWRRAPFELADPAGVRAAFAAAAAALPGSHVEEKHAGYTLHYRNATRDPAPTLAALREALAPRVRAGTLAFLGSTAALEVRPPQVTKVLALAFAPPGLPLLAAGDDLTDEELFVALPPAAVSVKVGDGATAARYRVPDPAELRRVLERLAGATP
jgi:trehalose 6-phosphate synthase/phosphatase